MAKYGTPQSSADFSTTIALIREYKQGNAEAADKVLRRYFPRLRQIVLVRASKKTVQRFGLDDLIQDSCVRALESFDGFEIRSHGRFLDWLSTVVLNTIRERIRAEKTLKRGRHEVIALDQGLAVATGDTPSKVASRNEDKERFYTALSELEEREREIIVLRKLCEMSYLEIATKLGLSTDAAKKRVTRAMATLRQRLGED